MLVLTVIVAILLEIAIVLEFTATLTVELPSRNSEELTETFEPTETVELLTVDMPIFKSNADKFATEVELETLNRELVCTEFTVLLPTNKFVLVIATLSPINSCADLKLPTAVRLAPKTAFPETFAVPVTVNDASGAELLIPTRFKSPSATIKLVFTTKPFFTTKSFSAI